MKTYVINRIPAIPWRDYPIVQNLVMFIALMVASINLIVDLGLCVA